GSFRWRSPPEPALRSSARSPLRLSAASSRQPHLRCSCFRRSRDWSSIRAGPTAIGARSGRTAFAETRPRRNGANPWILGKRNRRRHLSHTDLDLGSTEKRRALWIVLWLNVAIAAGFFVVAYIGDSNALLANGLDNSSDAAVYALSLLALTRSRTWKRGAARFSGVMLLIF